ncbi:MAG: VOC family protein [Myxococcota bacterium]
MTIQQLSYMVFEVSDLERWEHFASHVLGVQIVGRRDDGGFGMRIDGHAQRFVVRPGPLDDLVALGFEVATAADMDAVAERVRGHGQEVTPGSEAQAAERGVKGLIQFTAPGGVAFEIVHGPAKTDSPMVSKTVATHFVAGDLGAGHCVLRAASMEEMEHFLLEVMGFKLSDRIICDLGGYHVNITFTHLNPRHHSVAFGMNLPKRIHHFLLQVASLDDVGMAFDRAVDSGVRITQTIGRHPNDRMVSFYAQTPSGFEFEYGWGAREIDDAIWEPTTYGMISEWGHRRPPYRRPKK